MTNDKSAQERKSPGKRRSNRRAQLSLGRLRGFKGQHISAELLVKHLTGTATAAGAGAVAGESCAGSGTAPDAATQAAPGLMVMMIGLPASGKSSISVAFEQAGWVRINKDSLRKELYGDESTLGKPREVSALFYQRIEEAFKAGRNVLIDNTNVSSLHRKGPLAMALEHGYTNVTHVFLDVPLEECLRRNALRDRKVPEEGLRKLAQALASKGGVPSRREGNLIVLKPGDGVGDFIVDRVRMHGARQ